MNYAKQMAEDLKPQTNLKERYPEYFEMLAKAWGVSKKTTKVKMTLQKVKEKDI